MACGAGAGIEEQGLLFDLAFRLLWQHHARRMAFYRVGCVICRSLACFLRFLCFFRLRLRFLCFFSSIRRALLLALFLSLTHTLPTHTHTHTLSLTGQRACLLLAFCCPFSLSFQASTAKEKRADHAWRMRQSCECSDSDRRRPQISGGGFRRDPREAEGNLEIQLGGERMHPRRNFEPARSIKLRIASRFPALTPSSLPLALSLIRSFPSMYAPQKPWPGKGA
eukprot:2180641-Pleurochrysis_carterae.AAC.1